MVTVMYCCVSAVIVTAMFLLFRKEKLKDGKDIKKKKLAKKSSVSSF